MGCWLDCVPLAPALLVARDWVEGLIMLLLRDADIEALCVFIWELPFKFKC